MKKLILILALVINLSAFSQDDKTVTLVVSGQGKTQDEAKQNALRSAIELAFGTFISSKTEILNDSLVKDEIVSVANGNIQKFDLISEVQIPNGGYASTLKATVSVTKLTSFVESKGVVIEFKGNLLATNIKQQMLNEKNEIKSMSNIVNVCRDILDRSFDFEIVSGEPKQKNNDNNKWSVPLKINARLNKNIELFTQHLSKSIKDLSMSQEEIEQYKSLGKKTYMLAYGGKDNNISPIFHFRSKASILSIINLIYYIKHSVLNFEISNDIKMITPQNDKRFEITNDNLTPILGFCEDLGSYPKSVFDACGGGYGQPNYRKDFSLYEEKSEYDQSFIYGGIIKQDYNTKDNNIDKNIIEKYSFLNRPEFKREPFLIAKKGRDLYRAEQFPNCFYAVISNYDFLNYSKVLLCFTYEDILDLNEIERVQQYKIKPIVK
jgi:hypothetical protein